MYLLFLCKSVFFAFLFLIFNIIGFLVWPNLEKRVLWFLRKNKVNVSKKKDVKLKISFID